MIFRLIVSIIFGLIFGSFWSVILARRWNSETLKQASSIIRWRSECPHCKHTLQARDLVPLLSFAIQWWRCRYCNRKISRLYPILEIGSAIVFWLTFRYFYPEGIRTFLFWCSTGRILWLMIVYDVLRYEVHIPLLILWMIILLIAIEQGMFPLETLWWGVIFLIFFLILYVWAKIFVRVIYWVKEEWVGAWDVLMSPYLWTLLFTGIYSMTTIDKILLILYFFIFSWLIGLVWYAIQNKAYGRKAKFLKKELAEQSLPLVPSMILAVVFILIFKRALLDNTLTLLEILVVFALIGILRYCFQDNRYKEIMNYLKQKKWRFVLVLALVIVLILFVLLLIKSILN